MGVSCLRIEPIIDMGNSYRREFYPGLRPFQSGCREIVPQLLGRWVKYVLMPTKSALSGALDPDALTAYRPYRTSIPISNFLAIMSESVGTAIDPDCFNALQHAMGSLDVTWRRDVAPPCDGRLVRSAPKGKRAPVRRGPAGRAPGLGIACPGSET